MPIHDWTRVRANRFHHFHQTWTANLAAALNSGRLPPGFFALAEQITGGPEADVVALELNPPAQFKRYCETTCGKAAGRSTWPTGEPERHGSVLLCTFCTGVWKL